MPIVVFRWFERFDDLSLEFYADWFSRLLDWMEKENRRGVVVFDLRAADRLPPHLRRRVADFRATIDPLVRPTGHDVAQRLAPGSASVTTAVFTVRR